MWRVLAIGYAHTRIGKGTLPVIFSATSKMKDFLRSQAVTYTLKVIIASFFNTYQNLTGRVVGVYAFLIWNNVCDLVYQTPTKNYQSQIPVAFGIPGHVTTKHLPDTPC